MARKYPLTMMTRNGYQYVRLPFGIGYDEILADQRIQFGEPCIRGTRIPVETLHGCYVSGESIKQIANEYRITEKQVQVAIDYYEGK